ncbi:DNA-binding IclR family transcriptional regulator [Spinactinospora alkalitolerans]|uniref:DNA-binding IclR family transcriptional regulator n=1 Tax=Spinactinospora alkalitolerans TaxID=687207 RepID=A0A852TW03_9ACTN|nr:helix-turn-helix domain-containing protein [Spinactinospora alkalitolerans]NYE47042.1 DNA-binding IclR family transcriptional regulator [Spinactinospora alkalitolerans]
MPEPPSAGPGDDTRPRDSGLSKTLDNGLQILELLVRHPQGLSLTEIADGIGVHRTVAHRLVRTLEAHRLCHRDSFKRISLGNGLVRLAEPVEQDLRALARPVLEGLTDATRATAHLVVREDEAQVRMMMIVEPRHARMHVSFHAGQVDPIDRGSAGLAILAAQPPVPNERAEVARARERGFAVSYGEIASSITGISAPVPDRRGARPISIGLSLFEVSDEEALGTTVVDAAQRLGALL